MKGGPGKRDSARPPAQATKEPLLDGNGQAPPSERLVDPPEAPSLVSPITMVLEEEAILSAASLPKKSPQEPPKMSADQLVSAAVSELRSRGIADEDAFMDAKDIRPLYKAVRDGGLIEQVFARLNDSKSENPTKAEALAAGRPKAPPLPPRRSIPPAPSLRVGSDQVSGEEATIASEAIPQHKAGLTPPVPADAISKFLEELGTDVKLETQQRLDKAKEFYEAQLNALLAQCGGDDAKLRVMIETHQKSAKAKKEKRQQPNEMEHYITELTRLSSRVADLHKKLMGELEFKQMREKRKSALGMDRIPSPDRDKKSVPSMRPPADAEAAAALASPVRPPSPDQKKEAKPPSPDSKRPQAPPQNGKKEDEQVRASEPPQEGAPARKGRGSLARFMLSPVTWTVVGVGGFTAAMIATSGFDDLAQFFNLNMAKIPSVAPYIRRVWEGWLHLPPLESAKGSAALYYGLSGLVVLGGIYRKYRRVRKKEHELEELGIGEENFQKMRNYVVPILYRIYNGYSEGTYPKKLRTKLIEDSTFFLYMEEFYRNAAKFGFIMKEADVPPKQVAKFHVVFSDAENEIMKIRLEDYVKYIDDPGLRLNYLRETYDRDPLFRKKLDEVFFQNLAGEYVNKRKQTDVAKALGNGDAETGVPILKKLEMDYMRLTEKKEKK